MTVSLGSALRVEVVFPEAISDQLTVVASRVESGAVLIRQALDALPAGRDILSALAPVAGLSFEVEAAGISIDGSSGAENKVYLDGIDTTSAQKGIPAKEIPADFVSEVQVKTSGYPAEFGGSTGGVINVLTRSGGDRFEGSVGLRQESSDLAGDVRPRLGTDDTGAVVRYVRPREDDSERLDPAFRLGGPLVRGHAWFFLGAESGRTTTERAVDFIDGVRDKFAQEFQSDFLAIHLNAALGDRGSARLAVHAGPSSVSGALPDASGRGSSDRADYRAGEERDNEAAALHLDFLPASNWQVSSRATWFRTDLRTTGIEKTGSEKSFQIVSPGVFPEVPPELVRPVGFSTGPIYPIWDRDEYTRATAWFDAARDFSARGGHTVRAGVQAERIENSVLRDGSATALDFQWNTGDVIVGESARGRYGALAVHRFQTAGDVRTDNLALFLQDTWRVTPNLKIDFGLRAESEQVPDYRLGHEGEAAIDFEFGDKLAPRLGFAWSPGSGDTAGQHRIYANYGRYFDVTKYELARLSFGAERRIRYTYKLESFDWTAIDCEIEVNDPARVPECGPGAVFVTAVNLRNPVNDAIDPELKAGESEEWQLGYERQLTASTTAHVRFLDKRLVRVIEDIGAYVEGVGEVYLIGNPGEGSSRFAVAGTPLPHAERSYRAATLEVRRRLSGAWSLEGSYTYSRLHGNFPGLASSDEEGRAAPNVLRAFDGWFTAFDQSGRASYGRLGTDRPHQLKIFGTWRGRFGTSVGLYQYAGSGTPRTSVASRNHVAFFPFGRGDLGRSPTLTQTDLRISQVLDTRRGEIEVAFTALNLFDEDTSLDVAEELHGSSLSIPDAAFLAGFDTLRLIDEQGLRRKPTYGFDSVFQAGRRVLVSVAWRF